MYCIHIGRRLNIALMGIASLLVCAPIGAIDRITLHIARLQQSGIDMRDVDIQMQFPNLTASPASIRIAAVNLGATLGRFEDVQIDCPSPVIKEPIFSCEKAQIRARSSRFGLQNLQAGMTWNDRDRSLRFSANRLRVAGGQIDVSGVGGAQRWSMSIKASSIALAPARQLLGERLPLPRNWSLEGTLPALTANLSGSATLQHLTLQASMAGVALANPEGTTATDQLSASVDLRVDRIEGAWQLAASLHSAHGEALSGRWYWNFTNQPLQAQWRGQWSDSNLLTVDDVQLTAGGFLRANARGSIDLAAEPMVKELQVTLTDLDLAALPPQTRDGIFAGSLVAQLQGAGHFNGRIEIRDNLPAAIDLTLNAVRLEDQNAKLALNDVNGHLIWHDLERRKQALADKSDDTQSDLRWESGLLYGVQIGGAQIHFTTAGNDVRLMQAARIPILDGSLAIRTLQLRRIGEAAMSIRFDATLDPISVAQLCKAFGWPEFAGKLSGSIPDLSLEAGVLTLGGALQASVFDGRLIVRDLKLSDPFGARPRLQANVEFAKLDLEAVTGAFSFGKITGRIDGHISELELVGWEPMAFDAALFSTPGDRTRRRISQRAVENISSIGGGGAAAALQRSVMRFFKEFNYDKLGISCRLGNDVCLMQGVEARASGYYLVKGSGLPRIDVIGEAHRVDWPSLEATLKELPKSQASIGNAP